MRVHALNGWTVIILIFHIIIIIIVNYYTYNLIYSKKDPNANTGKETKRNWACA